MDIFYYVILVLFVMLCVNTYRRYKKKKEMGCLTGRYFHLKKPDGHIIKVQYSDNGFHKFRTANTKEIEILRKYKYLKL